MTTKTTTRRRSLFGAAARGALAGLAGVVAMTLGEKAEQRFTGRPDSFVPGRALLRLLGRRPAESAEPAMANHVIHWGTGALFGALRGVWSGLGIRGAQATVTHAVVRLAFDQTVENASGAGAPPAAWPGSERVVDYSNKALYALTTGFLADRWIRPSAQTARGRLSH